MTVRVNRGALAVAFFAPALCRAEESSGGLPQLDVSRFPEQVFWFVVAFSILYVLMSSIALPRIGAIKENRRQVIGTDLAAATAANEAAKAALAQVDQALALARAKAAETTNEMIAVVLEQSAARFAAREREHLRRLREAEADIAVTRENAMQAVTGAASAIADVVVAQVADLRNREAA